MRKIGSYVYEIVVYIGMFGLFGIIVNVFMIINVEKGEIEILFLMDIIGNKNLFFCGSVSFFVVKLLNFFG